MDAVTLAMKMLEWRKLRVDLDAMEAEIVAAVAEIEKTQTVGDVKCSYTKGRTSYDYKEACKGLEPEVMEAYTKTIPASTMVDYTALCKGEGIEAPVKSVGKPSVKLTIEVAK